MKLKIIKVAAMLVLMGAGLVSARGQNNTNSFSFSVANTVPDGNASGLANIQVLTGMAGTIANVNVTLNISGGFNGDLYAYLAGPNGGFAVLLNRVGVNNGDAFGYLDTGFNVTFDDSASYNNIHFYQELAYDLNDNGQLTGTWQPDGRAIDPQSLLSLFDSTSPTALLNSFNGTNPNGTWRLFLADLSNGEESQLVNWGLEITTIPEPGTLSLLALGGRLTFWRSRRKQPSERLLRRLLPQCRLQNLSHPIARQCGQQFKPATF